MPALPVLRACWLESCGLNGAGAGALGIAAASASGSQLEALHLSGNTLEGIADEVVHNRHTLLRDARLGVHLLQNLEDVRVEVEFDLKKKNIPDNKYFLVKCIV